MTRSFAAAEHLKKQGRGYDTELVHMNPKELQGLQALANQHGMHLTKNPKTGLYEAGILSSLLPTLAGAATMYFTGSPWGAALAGGLAGAATNKNDPLMGAGLGALGGWGGGNLLGGIASAGVGEIAANTAAEAGAAQQAMADLDMSRALDAHGGFAPDMAQQAAYRNASLESIYNGTPMPSGPAGADATNPFAARQADLQAQIDAAQARNAELGKVIGKTSLGTTDVFSGATPEQKWDFLSKGAGKVTSDPMSFFKDNWKGAAGAAAPFLGGLAGLTGSGKLPPGTGGAGQGQVRPFEYVQGQVNPRFGMPGEPYYLGQGFRPLAGGGAIHGLPAVQHASGGRLLQGPGDGLSDSIPATINGSHPAALADGEFVVSSDVVSALGGGSTKAGADKLYKMMDRVRMQAHGTKKQVRKVNHRVLPA